VAPVTILRPAGTDPGDHRLQQAWVYEVLDEAEEARAITVDQDGRTRRFTIVSVDALGGLVDA
jgi:hypothetical protein